ncbi:hypothetical protein [Epilithonimonas sp. UC225_85]|uniref:hypothetical protein n=1 Tax=Epilithonimonas sp. UC225_85 TaxID=3350167 RepID=UPI0036D30BF8
MAESKNNIITHGLSGKVGDLIVFSQRDGKTYVSKAPKPKTVEDSPKQKEHKLKFQKATLYAKSVINNPELKQMYAAKADTSKGMSTYNVAVADFFNAPEIQSIDLADYKGKKGDIIRILAIDDFAVKTVMVKIESENGNLIEEGAATDSGYEWLYTVTITNTNLTGCKITVTASDYPANLAETTKIL